MARIGIIANPVSGKDIRRLVADAHGIDNQQKANIVRRVLRGIAAVADTQTARVTMMPEHADIRRRAVDGLDLPFPVDVLDIPCRGLPADSREAAQAMAADHVDVIVVLGGDGTCRLVAMGCGTVPLLPISTGTNNVWPKRHEGTLAGLAAAFVADRRVDESLACRQTPRLDVIRNDRTVDMALVDVAACDIPVPGARAVWDISRIHQLVLSHATPGVLGLSAIGGSLPPPSDGHRHGLAIDIGKGGQDVLAPIAPGLVVPVPVTGTRWLAPGERVEITHKPGTLALDGERDTPVGPNDRIEVALNPQGPFLVDVDLTLELAAAAGLFTPAAIAEP